MMTSSPASRSPPSGNVASCRFRPPDEAPSAPRLLFDENLAARRVDQLRDVFPGSQHARQVFGPAATDEQIWEFGRDEDTVIVSKDENFQRFSVWRGFPPKVIWIQLGNCSTQEVAALLRSAQPLILAFVAHPDAGFLPLGARDA